MKGLTPKEYAALRYLESPHIPRSVGEHELALAEDLEEQGRIELVVYPEELRARYFITRGGREALRLYPLMQALEAA